MSEWHDFDFALIRLVPCVHRGNAINIGLAMYAPTLGFIRVMFIDDLEPLRTFAANVDLSRLELYLTSLEATAAGAPGPIGSMNKSERFHWLTAPRSDIIQSTSPHPGRTQDVELTFQRLFEQEVVAGLPL